MKGPSSQPEADECITVPTEGLGSYGLVPSPSCVSRETTKGIARKNGPKTLKIYCLRCRRRLNRLLPFVCNVSNRITYRLVPFVLKLNW